MPPAAQAPNRPVSHLRFWTPGRTVVYVDHSNDFRDLDYRDSPVHNLVGV